MKAGELDRRIDIQQAVISKNALNESISQWISLGTVWAKKTDVSDGERMRAAETSAQITTRFLIRWSIAMSAVNPKDRVVFDGRTYDIFFVKEIGRHEGIEISAAARADK